MTFLDNVDLWPRDISGNHIFFLKAVQEIGRGLIRKDTRLPSMMYRYDFDLPEFAHASEDDKAAAADVINSNTIVGNVDHTEKYFYSDDHEKSFLMRNAQISEQQWEVAGRLIRKSRETLIENVDSAIAIASAIFQGVASGKIAAVQRVIDQPKFMPLPAEMLNIDSDAVVKTRLALGQMNPDKPFDPDPRGFSYIFLESKSLKRWKVTDGNQRVRIEIAKRKIMRLVSNHDNQLSKDLTKENILDKKRTGFDLDDREKEMLWASLPDKPFKLPGLRKEEVGKG